MRNLLAAIFIIIPSISFSSCLEDDLTAIEMDQRYKISLEQLKSADTYAEIDQVKSDLICLSDHKYGLASELLASLFLGNEFGEPDLVSARMYLQRAFDIGSLDIKHEIAQSFLYGKFDSRDLGVDIEISVKYFAIVSTLGNADSSASLCSIYRTDFYG